MVFKTGGTFGDKARAYFKRGPVFLAMWGMFPAGVAELLIRRSGMIHA